MLEMEPSAEEIKSHIQREGQSGILSAPQVYAITGIDMGYIEEGIVH